MSAAFMSMRSMRKNNMKKLLRLTCAATLAVVSNGAMAKGASACSPWSLGTDPGSDLMAGRFLRARFCTKIGT